MKFMLSLMADEAAWEDMTPEQAREAGEAIERYNDELREGGVMVSGEGLQANATAKTIRFGGGRGPRVSDGPFSDAREQLVGFWLIDCDSVDDAVGWAWKAPIDGGAIEVRPLIDEDHGG